MSGALQMLMSYAADPAGTLNTTAFTADDGVNGGASEAYAEFNTNGSATLVGNQGTSPASPRWWSNSSPPATWMSYTATGYGGIITGGLAASTRYELNSVRKLGLSRVTLGSANRTFTITFFDAATGGNTLGTKTFTATAEYA